MIFLCIYLYVCVVVAALVGISIPRPLVAADWAIALLFPILFPALVISNIIRKVL